MNTQPPPEPKTEWMRRSDARADCRDLLNELGYFQWDCVIDMRPKTRNGQCRHRVNGPCEIGLTDRYVRLAEWSEVIDTIRHEVAHVIAGPHAGHNYKWRLACRTTGATPNRCRNVAENVRAKHKWLGTCECPGMVYKRHKLLRKMRGATCLRCRTKVSWKEQNVLDVRYQ